MSKISVAGVRTNVQQLLEHSNEKKKRNFLETVCLRFPSFSSFILSFLYLNLLVCISDKMIGRATNRSEELRSAAR